MKITTMLLQNSQLILAVFTLSVSAIPQIEKQNQLETSNEEQRSRRFIIGNSTYEISKTKVDWYMAKIDCSLKGMELVSIESTVEQYQIENAIRPYDEPMWTSGANNAFDSNFYWESTGHAIGPFSHWAKGKPGNEDDQNCIILNNTNGYLWHDIGCKAAELRFICEKRAYTGDQTRYSFEYGDSTYEVSALKLNWWNSKYDCLSRGMELVSIETVSENDAILQGIGAYNLSDAFWVSATDLGREGYFHWDSTGGALGLHADWAEDQPDNANKIEHCVILRLGSYEWSDENCMLSNRYLCEAKIFGFSNFVHNKNHLINAVSWKTSNQGPPKFKSNKITFENSTYEISTTKVDWYTAQMNCKLAGMELISIETREEQEAIAEELGSSDTEDNFWASGNDDMGSMFVWDSTGQTVGSYSSWAAGQPDNGVSINLAPQNCMMLNGTDNFKWYDLGCKNSGQLRFICEKKTSDDDEVTEFSYQYSRYEVSGLHVDWWTASRDCRSKGMQLVSIETQEENDAIIFGLQLFRQTTSFWTAANDHGHDRNFYWESTGEFLAVHSDWAVDEPDNVDGTEHCVLLDNDRDSDGNFRWSDKPCSLRKRFVCELNTTIAQTF